MQTGFEATIPSSDPSIVQPQLKGSFSAQRGREEYVKQTRKYKRRLPFNSLQLISYVPTECQLNSKMSFPTTTAFIHSCKGWDETTRLHPAMKWFEKYALLFNSGQMFSKSSSEWHTENFSYHKSTGEIIEGGTKAFDALKETYAPFDGTNHEPNFLICWETKDGWEMLGQALLYGNLKAPGGSGKVHTDVTGQKWDVGVPSAFHFAYVKDSSGPEGIKLERTDIFSDSAPVLVEMLKRGMLKPEQLFG
jgi:hypothetical protein